MPISRLWANSVMLNTSLLTGLAAAAEPAPPSASARVQIEQEADAAMARVRATAPKRTNTTRSPTDRRPSSDPTTRAKAAAAIARQSRDAAMDARARTARAQGAEALARDRAAMLQRLERALGLEPPEVAALAQAAAPKASGWVPVLLVSSSMPVAMLRTYASQLERVNGALVFRGMPGGLHKVAPMAKLSAEILRLDPGCEGPACAMRNVSILIDPLLFRQTGVTRVPALAMLPGDPVQPYCERDAETPPPVSHIVYGDSAFTGLLDEYARLGGKQEVRDAQTRLQNR